MAKTVNLEVSEGYVNNLITKEVNSGDVITHINPGDGITVTDEGGGIITVSTGGGAGAAGTSNVMWEVEQDFGTTGFTHAATTGYTDAIAKQLYQLDTPDATAKPVILAATLENIYGNLANVISDSHVEGLSVEHNGDGYLVIKNSTGKKQHFSIEAYVTATVADGAKTTLFISNYITDFKRVYVNSPNNTGIGVKEYELDCDIEVDAADTILLVGILTNTAMTINKFYMRINYEGVKGTRLVNPDVVTLERRIFTAKNVIATDGQYGKSCLVDYGSFSTLTSQKITFTAGPSYSVSANGHTASGNAITIKNGNNVPVKVTYGQGLFVHGGDPGKALNSHAYLSLGSSSNSYTSGGNSTTSWTSETATVTVTLPANEEITARGTTSSDINNGAGNDAGFSGDGVIKIEPIS